MSKYRYVRCDFGFEESRYYAEFENGDVQQLNFIPDVEFEEDDEDCMSYNSEWFEQKEDV